MIYDIFGPSSQALQGADRISQHFDGCMVIMPDLFKGNALRYDQRANAREFLAGPGAYKLNADAVRLDVIPAVRELFPQFDDEGLGAFGLCWGGKIVVLLANADTTKMAPFGATGQAHPGGLDVADAEMLKAPHICLASKDEDKNVVAGYATTLADSSPGSVVETYANMFHGWMGTRANLDDEENRVAYETGYRQVAEFFSKHL
jgi:dienelactone hydrolase